MVRRRSQASGGSRRNRDGASSGPCPLFLVPLSQETLPLPPSFPPQVPIEVRVPSYFAGNLSVHAFLTPAGGSFQARVANAPELEVTRGGGRDGGEERGGWRGRRKGKKRSTWTETVICNLFTDFDSHMNPPSVPRDSPSLSRWVSTALPSTPSGSCASHAPCSPASPSSLTSGSRRRTRGPWT